MSNVQTYKRFADCIPVCGFLRSLIMDLTHENFKYIPKELYKILTRKIISKEQLTQEYWQFLTTNEYIFRCNKKEVSLYPDLNTEWDYPASITNALLEIRDKNYLDIVIPQLVELGCYHLMIVCQRQLAEGFLHEISILTKETPIKTVEVYGKYTEDFNLSKIGKILKDNPRFSFVLLFNAPFAKILSEPGMRGNIIFFEKSFSWTNSGIALKKFRVNLTLYTESLHYNNFFNRKICINECGQIKHYPTYKQSFGSVFSGSLSMIINSNNYQDCWKICKDKITICTECEYRYMCVDHRIPVKAKNGLYYFKDSKCPYNPYICKWQGEEGYVPVEECGTYTRETGFVPDKKKIRALNKKIWNEE